MKLALFSICVVIITVWILDGLFISPSVELELGLSGIEIAAGTLLLIFASGFGALWEEYFTRFQSYLSKSLNIEEQLAKIMLSNFGGKTVKAWIIRIIGCGFIILGIYNIVNVV